MRKLLAVLFAVTAGFLPSVASITFTSNKVYAGKAPFPSIVGSYWYIQTSVTVKVKVGPERETTSNSEDFILAFWSDGTVSTHAATIGYPRGMTGTWRQKKKKVSLFFDGEPVARRLEEAIREAGVESSWTTKSWRVTLKLSGVGFGATATFKERLALSGRVLGYKSSVTRKSVGQGTYRGKLDESM